MMAEAWCDCGTGKPMIVIDEGLALADMLRDVLDQLEARDAAFRRDAVAVLRALSDAQLASGMGEKVAAMSFIRNANRTLDKLESEHGGRE